MDVAAERFGLLLHPIRDAALAFEVDVSSELEEYIEQCVRSLGMDESHLLNFAEAGLLLQGSALILGRKVEHLHGLVYKVLSKLRTQRAEGHDDAEEEEEAHEPTTQNPRHHNKTVASSLCLVNDSELQLGKNIDLIPKRKAIHTVKDRLPALFEEDERNDAYSAYAFRSDGGLVLQDLLTLFSNNLPEEANLEEEVPPPPPPLDNNEDDDEPMAPPQAFDDDYDDPPPMMDTSDDHYEAPLVSNEESPPEDDDPYAEMDPHLADENINPFRRGKTWKMPSSEPAKKRKKNGGIDDTDDDVDAVAAASCAAVRGTKNTLELARAAKRAIDRRIMARRRDNFYATIFPSHEEQTPLPEDNDDDDDLPAPPAAFDDDHFEEDAAPPSPLDDDYGHVSFQDDDDDDEVRNNRRRETMESMMSCNTISRLARRVAAWQEHLEPILRSREERGPYDAKKAGMDLAEDLKLKGSKKVAFSKVADELPRFEVCRRFLATLQLANEGRVGLQHPNDADDLVGRSDFTLSLLVDDSRLEGILDDDDEEGRHSSTRENSI